MENDITLEKMKFVIIQALSKELWEEAKIVLNNPKLDFSLHARFMIEGITERLISIVLTKTEGKYEFRWYKSWWEELKTKLLPHWWLNRYPSKMEVKKKIKAFSAYPSIKIEDVEHIAWINFHDLHVPKEKQ